MDIRLSQIKVTLPHQAQPLFEILQFQIPFGSKILIQGASGKGKTTLLHLIAGFFLPEEGHVFWGDTRLDHLSEAARTQLRRENSAIIFQNLNLIEHLTAFENILLGLKKSESKTDQNNKALNALKKVSLENKKDTLSTYMSLGEQQRVAVSRVIAQEPKVILADEPTSSLDEKNAFAVIDALFEASKNGTLIVVSHDHRITHKFQKVIQFEELCQ